ncbi:hypothetical protein PVK06_024301 [Gossypium arboreum]|uniref:Uncharacterized protein n=1 Tax=Gossypium arboreum TaxID=29729 RepID=A0ABR0PDD9_GOSAR|nr:hypothetical protein PVK06_024301 [Gossypium arboreum]
MTCCKDMPIPNEAETSKIRKGKTKADSKRSNLNVETSLWRKLKDVEYMVNCINNRQIRFVATMEKSNNLFYAYTKSWNSSIVATFGQLSPSSLLEFPVFLPIIRIYDLSSTDDDFEDQDRSVASLPIVQISNNNKEEGSRDIELYL